MPGLLRWNRRDAEEKTKAKSKKLCRNVRLNFRYAQGGDWQGFLRKITGERTRLKLYPYFVATFFAELGEKDKAFAMLNEAIETKDQHTAQMKVDPYMNPLRDDPRFREVLEKAGFTE